MPRHAVSIDATQHDIAETWADFGFVVLDLHKAPRGFSFVYNGTRYHGGIADLECHMGPVGVFVECKVPGGELNAAQRFFRDMCKAKQIPYFVECNTVAAARDAEDMRDWGLQRVALKVPGT